MYSVLSKLMIACAAISMAILSVHSWNGQRKDAERYLDKGLKINGVVLAKNPDSQSGPGAIKGVKPGQTGVLIKYKYEKEVNLQVITKYVKPEQLKNYKVGDFIDLLYLPGAHKDQLILAQSAAYKAKEQFPSVLSLIFFGLFSFISMFYFMWAVYSVFASNVHKTGFNAF